jgi:hypothetical protein
MSVFLVTTSFITAFADEQYNKIIKWLKLVPNQYIGFISKQQFSEYITIRNKVGKWVTFKVQSQKIEDFKDNEMVTVSFPNDFEIINLSETNYNDGKFIVKNFKKRRFIN